MSQITQNRKAIEYAIGKNDIPHIVSARMSTEHYRKLKKIAIRYRVPISAAIRLMIEDFNLQTTIEGKEY